MKIRVIGGGWYGCHCAVELMKDPDYDVTLFERGDQLMNATSSANQSRLHLGFHYPRCSLTRREARDGAAEFVRVYPQFTRPVATNIYAIAKDESWIDFGTYIAILRADGTQFVTIQPDDFGLTNLEGAVLTGERLIDPLAARHWFEEQLGDRVRLEYHSVINNDMSGEWDVTVNCTYGGLATPGADYFEPCALHFFEGDDRMAVTIMDGPYGGSLYPFWVPGMVSLTSVAETPFGNYPTYGEALERMNKINSRELHSLRDRMIKRLRNYMPEQLRDLRHIETNLGIRALPNSLADRRTWRGTRDGRVLHVRPGKISNIFSAARWVNHEIDSIFNEGLG